jgi:glycosyltransferase involved in cell wall biosynthesis
MSPFFTVIVPCYNTGAYLSAALLSIRQQTFKDYELIVVNDGSTDPLTLDIFNSLRGGATVIKQPNRGQGCARNGAIKLAKGKYLAFLDSDDLWQPFALEYLHHAITQCHAQLCFAEVMQFNSDHCLTPIMAASGSTGPSLSCFESFHEFYQATSKTVYIPGAFCVRKELLSSSIRFHEGRINGEDLHLILQLVKTSNVAWIKYPALLYYREHQGNSTKDYSRGALGLVTLYRERAKGSYARCRQDRLVVSKILSSHARSISILMLYQHQYSVALHIYWLALSDNFYLCRLRYLVGFWFIAVLRILRIKS